MSWLVAELLVVFVLCPAVLAIIPKRLSPIPILILTAVAMLAVLFRDPTFDASCLTRLPRHHQDLLRIVAPMPLLGSLMVGLLYLLVPDEVFRFVRRKPRLWAVVMLVYPITSVVPQTIIFRVFFIHRYAPLFGNGWGMIVAAGLMFGFGHIIFRHHVPVLLTAIGGFIFAADYLATGSAPLSAIQHAIYGDLAFTIGYSYYLYHGSVRLAERATPAHG